MLVLLAVIAAFTAYAVALDYGTNTVDSGDYLAYSSYSHIVAQMGIGGGYAFLGSSSTGYAPSDFIAIIAPALIYRALGFGAYTRIMFEVLCAIGTAAVVYLIGSRACGRWTGVLCAALFLAIPDVLLEADSSGIGMPVALFSSIAALAMVEGLLGRRYRYCFVSCLVGMLGGIAGNAQALLVFVFLALAVAWASLTFRREDWRSVVGWSAGGLLCGALVVAALGYALLGSPLAYAVRNSAGSGVYVLRSPTPPALGVAETLFPLPWAAQGGNSSVAPLPSGWPFLFGGRYSQLTDYIQPDVYSGGTYTAYSFAGLFGWALLAAGAYALARRVREAYMPLAWFASVALYMSFGVDFPGLSYFIAFSSRYISILLPPMALVIGISLGRVLGLWGGGSNGTRRRKPAAAGRMANAKRLVAVAALTVLLANAAAVSVLFSGIYYEQLQPALAPAHYIASLPAGTQIYIMPALAAGGGAQYNATEVAAGFDQGAAEVIDYATGYRYMLDPVIGIGACGELKPGSYVVQFTYPGIYAFGKSGALGTVCGNADQVLNVTSGGALYNYSLLMPAYDIWPGAEATLYRIG